MADKERPGRRGVLGKGIHSLLGEVASEAWQLERSAPTSEKEQEGAVADKSKIAVHLVDPALIDANPEQPRKIFAEEELQSLAASIAQDGVIQPLLVMSHKQVKGRYILIAGERRLRASKMAGLKVVPVLIKESQLDERLRLALIENIQRANLNVIEEAQAYQSLIQDYGLTQEQCAQKVGKERSSVSNALRILKLPLEIQEDLQAGRLTLGHAKAFLSLDDQSLQRRARDLVLKKQLSVRKTEELCKSLKKAKPIGAVESGAELDPDMEYIADNLRSYLRTKVKLNGSSQRGKIEISYFSAVELERLLSLIGQRLT